MNKITNYDKALIHIGLNLLYDKAYHKRLTKEERYLSLKLLNFDRLSIF